MSSSAGDVRQAVIKTSVALENGNGSEKYAEQQVHVPADGGFKLELPVGRYRLVAGAKGYETAHSPPTHVFREKYSFVKLALRPVADDAIRPYEVLVLDYKTRAPLPGTAVEDVPNAEER